MDPTFAMRVGEVIYLSMFFLVVPLVVAGIAYAAWRGKPRSWDRSMFFTAFASAGAVSAFLITYAIKMQADVRTSQYAIQVAFFVLGLLLFAIAGGCAVGIFLTKRGSTPKDAPQ
jgi:NhaP-type Na+/H+ or K+/H+ antiporter